MWEGIFFPVDRSDHSGAPHLAFEMWEGIFFPAKTDVIDYRAVLVANFFTMASSSLRSLSFRLVE